MRKLMLVLAAAGSALAVAAPAAAQYHPAPQGYGYGSGYGYGHGAQWGHTRALQARVDGIQRQIRHLRDRRLLTRSEAESLRERSRLVEYRLRRAAQYGLSPQESHEVQRRIARLEQRLYRDAHDGRRYGAGHWGGGQNGYYGDRDRDGRDDRYEDDRGRDRDHRYDDDRGRDRDDD